MGNRVTGAMNRALPRTKVWPVIRIRVYNVLARPVLTYGSEVWVLKENTKRQITAAEMKFMQTTAGHTSRDHKRKEDVLRELQVELILENIEKYRKNWRKDQKDTNEEIIAKGPRIYPGRKNKSWKTNEKVYWYFSASSASTR